MTAIKKPFGLESFELVDGRWKLPIKRHIKRHTCIVSYCQRDPAENQRYCNTCRSRIWRANNPVKYAYWNLKNRAKQRGHHFSLTLAHFHEVVTATGWMEQHGRFAQCLSIDRKQDDLGYRDGNIQVLSVSENIRKRYAPTMGDNPQPTTEPQANVTACRNHRCPGELRHYARDRHTK